MTPQNITEFEITDISKTALAQVADVKAEQILALHNPLNADIELKAASEVIALVREKIKPDVLQELSKSHNSKMEFKGIKIEERSTGISYDFTDSTTWNDLQDQIDELKAKQKLIEEMMKLRMKNPTQKYYDDEGTEVPCAKFKNEGSQSIVYTFPK